MTEITLVAILPGRSRPKADEFLRLLDRYLGKANQYLPCASATFEAEDALFASVARHPGRSPAHLILFDPRGPMLSSDDFARLLGRLRDSGTQRILLAVGPPDGWSPAARARAASLVSFGPITLPHELARVVAAEQIYRALTILAGHPYHSGHSGH